MSVCKYSHIRTCLCSMCHLIFPCFMTTSMFPRKYFDSMSCSHTQVHTLQDVSSHTFCFMEMCPSTVWHLVFHYLNWCEGTINVAFTVKNVPLRNFLTYMDVSTYTFSNSWTCLYTTCHIIIFVSARPDVSTRCLDYQTCSCACSRTRKTYVCTLFELERYVYA